MDFEQYRNQDGSLNLQKAFSEMYSGNSANWLAIGLNYILKTESLSKIKSRQIAAVILMQAEQLANQSSTRLL